MAENYSFRQDIGGNAVIRESDGAAIPLDLANQDYQAFLRWVAEPNSSPEGWTGPLNPTPDEAA